VEAIIDQNGNVPQTFIADTLGISRTQSFPHLLPVAWSPDSRLLAGFGCSDTTCDLALVQARSGQVKTIVSAKRLRLWDLTWSPQGVYLIYSVDSSDADIDGVVLWNRATGEHRRLMQASERERFMHLQWAADGCALYAAQRKEKEGAEPVMSAIWQFGPSWEDHRRLVPSLPDASPVSGANPLCPPPLLEGRRLIAYYGAPSGPGLGILGRYDITETLRLLKEQNQAYQDLDPGVDAIPTFHMVTTIADDFAGPDGDYNHRISHGTIRRWIDSVEAEGGWSILDVQPGRATLVDELDALEPLLLEPTVHLAVDPEFIVGDHQIPGEDLGQITGSQINWIQARLDSVARRIGRRKLLVIHQFDDRMVEHKEMILDYPLVDLVWDADGFGTPGAKIQDYNQYKTEAGFEYGGFKIFYNYDQPVMTPEEVLSLSPSPRLVIYQ
jgi:WD40 repeat protein